MKKTASHSFAVLTASLMMIGAVGCSTLPETKAGPDAEMPPTVDSVSSTTTAEPIESSNLNNNPAPVAAPVMESPSSLGASSSGRGH